MISLFVAGLILVSISVVADVVVRNVYYKYLHPKEALVSDGVLNRFVAETSVVFFLDLRMYRCSCYILISEILILLLR